MTGARSARRRGPRNCPSGASRGVRVLLAMMLVLGCHADAALAQRGRPSIIIPAPLHFEPASQAALPIQIAPADAVPRGSFVRLRGLPTTAALSDGHSIAPGAWAVPLTALPRLKILLPEGATGESEISVALVSSDGTVVTEARATLVVAAPPAPSAATALRVVPTQRPEDAQPVPQLTTEARERALRLVKKGDEQLTEGGIAQARLLYERAATAGLALGAMAMAATYDPAELSRLGVLGLKPDRETARRWYERARQLGAPEAEGRLRRLEAN